MERKIKVLHILSSHVYSGAENVVYQIVNMFRDDPEYEMLYCSPDGPIREALKARQVPFRPVAKVGYPELKQVIREYQPDIIHAHDVKAGIVAAATAGKIPVISHIHACFDTMTRVSVKSLSYLAVSWKFKKIFWVSDSSLKRYAFSKVVQGKSQVLYNVIDKQRLTDQIQADQEMYDYDVVFLGRFTDQKNPERLVRILTSVQKKMKEAAEEEWRAEEQRAEERRAETQDEEKQRKEKQLVNRKKQRKLQAAMIGTGELYDPVKQIVETRGLSQVILLPGYMSNPYKALKSAKVFLMASRYEGTPMSVLEAMALGVPVVSTPVDGIADVVEPGVNGYLEEEDDALAEKIIFLLNNPEKQKEMSAAASRHFDEICNLEHYKEILNQTYQTGIRE